MAHKINSKAFHKLDNEDRRKKLPPELILEKIGLKSGDTMIDVGAGIGYFSIPAAALAGDSGRVIAADIAQDMLDELARRADGHRGNLKIVMSSEDNVPVESHCADLVFISFVFHEFENPESWIREIARLLKPGGRAAVMEFQKKETAEGPPVEHRVSSEALTAYFNSGGFSKTSYEEFSDTYYLSVFVKN